MSVKCMTIWILVCYYAVEKNEAVGIKFNEESVSATSVQEIEAVLGKVARLPCDVEPTIANDKVHIIIWFKEIENKDFGVKKKLVPIFSLDARDKPIGQAQEWKDEKILGQRSTFRLKDRPAVLLLNSVREDDGAIYYCRVDFKQTPTRNNKVNLTIIVPTEKLKILEGSNSNHIKDYKLGPFNEGSSVNITCEATGGRPLPKVTWWLENALLDESMEYVTSNIVDPDKKIIYKVRNILNLEKLSRKTIYSVFTCQATNSRLVQPISSTIRLDINLKPLWVQMRGANKPLSAGHTYELECEVVGSRPTPTITWWKGSIQMKNTRETTSPDGNITTSVLTFEPTIEDAGKYLSCRGQQSLIPDSGLEDGRKLDIHHVPVVSLELGSTLNGSTIKEGVDVYFECNIKSDPWVYKVSWNHNGKPLYSNMASGTIVSNQSLVLQSITATRSGLYNCIGHNQEGDGESNSVMLDVKFVPHCRLGQSKIFGVAKHETAKIPCEVEANPQEVDFVWKFNNSAEALDISSSQIYSEKTRSVAVFKPITDQDFGTLLCWGKNEIGTQKEPCVYYITPAGKPDPLTNCTISNQTSESIYIECSEGFDGGLPQVFIIEVFDTAQRKLVSNVTSKIPVFVVTGLENGAGFDVSLYAANRKGRSSVSYLSAFTLKGAEKRTASTPVMLQFTPLLGILIGIVATLILIAIIIVVVIRLREGSDSDDKDYDDATRRCVSRNDSDKTSTEPLNKDTDDFLEEKNPDIIPQKNAEDDFEDEERAFERLNNAPSVKAFSKNNHHHHEVTYAQLSQIPPHVVYNQHPPTVMLNNVMRRHEPTVYAQLDMKGFPPHPGGFQTLHRTHIPSYMALPIRDDQILTDRTNNGNPLIKDPRMSSVTSTLPRSTPAARF